MPHPSLEAFSDSLTVQQFNVLETMYPTEFLEFRSFLGTSLLRPLHTLKSIVVPASGFQSRQFRVLEVRALCRFVRALMQCYRRIDWDCELICVCSINAQCTKSFFTMKIESIWKQAKKTFRCLTSLNGIVFYYIMATLFSSMS